MERTPIEREWARRAALHLQLELERMGITYEELAARLKELGFSETAEHITRCLISADITPTIFMSSLASIGNRDLPCLWPESEKELLRLAGLARLERSEAK